MIRAIKLQDNKSVLDLKIGQHYIAKYSGNMLHLNNIIKTNTSLDLKEGELVAARVSKIEIPNKAHIEVIKDEFVIIHDKETMADAPEQFLEKARPQNTKFSWEHKDLDAMKESFVRAATIIRNAIYNNVPIIIRHHNDTDGYCAGIALERAIKPLIEKEHLDYSYRYYTRSSSKTPFYDYLDASKDIEYALSNAKRFGNKLPLIVLTDLGSGEENDISLSMVKLLGAKVVIVDHHIPGELKDGKSNSCKYASAHVNPYLNGGNSGWTAGILSYELGRFINKDASESEIVPGLSAIADKTDLYNMDIYNYYLKLAEKRGLSQEFLRKLVRVVDFESQSVKWLEIPTIMDSLFGYDKQLQQQLVDTLLPIVEQKVGAYSKVVQKYAQVKDFDKFRFVKIDVDKLSFMSEYPGPGRITAIAHEQFLSEKGTITLGKLNGMIVFRADNTEGFNVHDILSRLQEKLPHALVSGGGHAAAGSIKYLVAAEEEVIMEIEGYISRI